MIDTKRLDRIIGKVLTSYSLHLDHLENEGITLVFSDGSEILIEETYGGFVGVLQITVNQMGQKEELATLDDLLLSTRQGGAFNIYLLKVKEFVEDASQGCQLSLDELKTLYSRGWHPKRAARLCDGKTTKQD